MEIARLVRRLIVPGFAFATDDRREALRRCAAGFGGFCIFGGDVESVRAFVREARAAARDPLLIMADYEDGVGAMVRGATEFPTNMAVGATESEECARWKGLATAREMRALDVDLALAPVVDVQVRAENPIVNVRSFGGRVEDVHRLACAFVEGMRIGGALSCAKHFPGHGDAAEDSHLALPRVGRPEPEPFRCGAETVMLGHLQVPEWDARRPATISPAIVSLHLRRALGFAGPVLTDALMMKACAQIAPEEEIAVRAVEAGVDALLFPSDPDAVAARLERAVRTGRIPRGRIEESLARWSALPPRAESGAIGSAHEEWAREIAERAIMVRGSFTPGVPSHVEVVRDDTSWQDGREFEEAVGTAARGPRVVAVFSRVRAFRGHVGLPQDLLARARAAKPDVVVLFGNPYIETQFEGVPIVYAWGDCVASQRAAARVVRAEIEPRGRDPR
jgi:beta-glucosidase-like glycosyl hydrolase